MMVPTAGYVGLMSDCDVATLPLDLVVHEGRRDRFSPTLADDCVSPSSTSPATTSDTGIETGSDVSSSCGDAAYRLSLAVVPAATATSLRLGYDGRRLSSDIVKTEPDSAAYRATRELGEQVRATMTSPAAVVSRFQCGVTVGYTYDAFVATDGRSRRRKPTTTTTDPGRGGPDGVSTRRATGRYACSECGRHYATSSNLSRHKQTHRSLDSRYARSCPHCHKPYVSMPALAMHVLTHDLKLVTSASASSSSSSSSS